MNAAHVPSMVSGKNWTPNLDQGVVSKIDHEYGTVPEKDPERHESEKDDEHEQAEGWGPPYIEW
jgi:hypothetical protein